MKRHVAFAICSVVSLAFAASVQAEVLLPLLAWDVSGDDSPVTLLADSAIDSNLRLGVGTNTLLRTGVSQNTGANSFNSSGWNLTDTFNESDDYIAFLLAPESGHQMTLTDLQYRMYGSSTAPGTGRWGYSVGGSAFVLQNTFSLTSTLPVGLAEWNFADFTTDQIVEFRFWAYGLGSISGGTSGAAGTVRIGNGAGDDLVLNGSTATIPEPSTLTLLGAGLIGVLILARRRLAW